MSLSVSTRRFAILLLLFCLPFQMVSAAALACLHADSSDPAMESMACHAATLSADAADADAGDADNLTQCQKCALDLVLLAAPSDIALQPVLPLVFVIDKPKLQLNAAKVFLPPLQRPPLSLAHI